MLPEYWADMIWFVSSYVAAVPDREEQTLQYLNGTAAGQA